MGGFHCPLGAMAPGTEGCIGCGLCAAKEKADYAAAAEKLRAWLREHAPRPSAVRKMAVCGKGGVGKSLITAVFARALAGFGYRVLVLDTDESNPTLARALGLPQPANCLRSMDDSFNPVECGDWIRDVLTIDEIPAEYISFSDGPGRGQIALVTTGKIEDPFQGCACKFGLLSRELMLNLRLADHEIVIADVEAGVESFGRGVERGADTVIAVAEPTLDSVEVAEKVRYMAEGIGISRVRVVANKVPSEAVGEALLELLAEREIRYLGWLPVGGDVAMHALAGTPLAETDETYVRVKGLLELLLDENEMDHPVCMAGEAPGV